MIAAPTCTVGPSRPIVEPPRIASNVTAILPNGIRSDSSRDAEFARSECSAAMTCGMPLPSEPGKNVRVSHTASAATAA